MQNGGGKRGNRTRICDQMMRLLTSSLLCVYHDKKKGICDGNQFHISRSFQFWWSPLKTSGKNLLLD